ncbi:hypothetical protein LSAT2_010265, partial [Lamellibrachia satsuma]
VVVSLLLVAMVLCCHGDSDCRRKCDEVYEDACLRQCDCAHSKVSNDFIQCHKKCRRELVNCVDGWSKQNRVILNGRLPSVRRHEIL